jgi:hypothetical protein
MNLLPALLIPMAVGIQISDKNPAFNFNGQPYFHRYSKGNLHEFTPKGQSDLLKFADMVTINRYPSAKDGESLAATANNVLEVYKSNGAKVLKTSSVPRTEKKPAEHLIVVVFGRPNFLEASFARFSNVNGAGASMVYSHRIYGAKVGDAMMKWLGANGEKVEKSLMAMPAKAFSAR